MTSLRLRYKRILAINFAAAVVALLLQVVFYHYKEPGALAIDFLASLIYANAIGTLCAVSMMRWGRDVRRRRFPLNWILLISMILAASILGTLAGTVVLVVIRITPMRGFWHQFYGVSQFAAVISLMFGLSVYFYEGIRSELEQKQLEEERARKLAAEAQLSSLAAQVHPHFLFNTLNSISSLIPEDPKQAEDMVGKLAALLRFSLDANRQRLVPLRQELKIVADYLKIEKARFGKRLRYSIEAPSELEALEVPPLSLQTLVENSVKFAVAPRREGASIRVGAHARNGRVSLEVSDDGPGFTAESIRPGHGLDSLRERLAALFGPEASLEIRAEKAQTAVRLSLPQTRNTASV